MKRMWKCNGQRGGDGRDVSGDRFGEQSDDDEVLFDVGELDVEWWKWLPGVDYTRTIREAKAGRAVVQGMVRGVRRPGSRLRVVALSTRRGEPVTRVDMHPDGWRELAGRVSDGERYRRLVARGVIKASKSRGSVRWSGRRYLYDVSPPTVFFGVRFPK